MIKYFLSEERKEENNDVIIIHEKVSIVLSPEVWVDLPFNEEGHPDQEQINAWKHHEYQQTVDEWLSQMNDNNDDNTNNNDKTYLLTCDLCGEYERELHVSTLANDELLWYAGFHTMYFCNECVGRVIAAIEFQKAELWNQQELR